MMHILLLYSCRFLFFFDFVYLTLKKKSDWDQNLFFKKDPAKSAAWKHWYNNKYPAKMYK